ncbi:MAG: hypothetical protein GYB68_15990 [Chloroflexi bacterium]|nr:hypothetical protein [Chloroflexota bacterium]
MSNVVIREDKKINPLAPAIGFVVMLGIGAVAWIVSPDIVFWMATTEFALGGGLMRVLPINFPASWPVFVPRLIVSLLMFLVFSTILWTVVFMIMPSRNAKDEDTKEVIKEFQQRQKKRRRR